MIVYKAKPPRGGRRIALVSKAQNFRERDANRRAREVLAELLGPEIRDTIATWRGRIPQDVLQAAVFPQANVTLAVEVADVPRLRSDLGTVLGARLEDAITRGFEIGERFAPPDFPGVPATLATEAAAGFIEAESLQAVANIGATTGDGIRAALLDQLRDEISPTEAARRVGTLAGLTPQQATAVRNFRNAVTRQLIPLPDADTPATRAVIERQVEAFRDRQLRSRGANIAETELQAAIMQGERSFYEVAADAGAVERGGLSRQWFTVQDDRVCPICRPLHGQIVGFDESFSSPAGWVGIAPPAHNRCRCYIKYRIEEMAA